MNDMTPDQLGVEGIFEPNGGWRKDTYYEVEVAFSRYNVIHLAVFYTGLFSQDDPSSWPGNYNQVWNPVYDRRMDITDVYYMRPIDTIHIFPARNSANKPEEENQ